MLRIAGLICLLLPLFLRAQTFEPSFRHYTTDDGLPSSEVYNVVQDDRGYLWFATDRGLSRFDGSNFKNYTLENGLPSVAVYRVIKDHKGRIWGTPGGGNLFYIENDEVFLYPFNHLLDSMVIAGGNPISIEVGQDETMHLGYVQDGYIAIDKDGNVSRDALSNDSARQVGYRELEEGSILYVSGKSYTVSERFIHERKEDTLRTKIRFSRNMRLRLRSKADEHYLLTYEELVKLNGSEDYDVRRFDHLSTGLSETPDLIWVGLLGGGAYGVNPKNIHQTKHHVLRNRSVTDVFCDHEGGFWFTTYDDGVYYTPSLEILSANFADAGPHRVSAVTSDTSGAVYASVDESKVYRYRDGNWSSLPLDTTRPYGDTKHLTYHARTNDLFYSTSAGTYRIDLETYDYETISTATWGIFEVEDRPGTYRAAGHYMFYTLPTDSNWQFETKARMRDLYVDHHGTVWGGGFGGLMYVSDTGIVNLGERDSLLSIRVEDISSDENNLYVATIGTGLLILDSNRDSVLKIGTEDGMLSEVANCLLVEKNKLYVGTNRGLNVLSLPLTFPYDIKSYTRAEGLVSDEITNLTAANDTIWIATRRGLSILPANNAEHAQTRAYLQLQKILVNDENTPSTSDLNLSYNENTIEFRFAAISFKNSRQTSIRYRLEGADNDWVYGNNFSVRYTSLPPGTFRFHVESRNDNGEWESDFAPVQVEIRPAIWQTWWFWVLINLLVIGMIYLLYRRRVSRVKRESFVEEELRRFQLQALSAQMNPHFLFNSLNAIQDVLLHKSKIEASSYLTRFARLMRRILDNSAETSIPLEHELEAIRLYIDLEQLRFESQFEYTLEVEPNINLRETLVPTLLIQPFVENAIWHGLRKRKTPGGELEIKIYREGEALFCSVTDNGVGRKATATNQERSHKPRGTDITGERLKLLQGVENRHQIEDLLHKDGTPAGTRVTLKLPFTIKKSQNE